MLTTEQISSFKNHGYLVLPGFTADGFCANVMAFAERELQKETMPLEYDADQGYLKVQAPHAVNNGRTVSRLLSASSRHPMLVEWATDTKLKAVLISLLGQNILLLQAHHNCITIKHPVSSRMMGWHQDSQYWHYERPELVSAWLALGEEHPENGGLWVLPGSHKWVVEAYQLDDRQCLRMDSLKNREWLERAHPVVLHQGDLLLLHSNVFHASGRNTTGKTKFSMVFTYRANDNLPIRGSRSYSVAEIVL